MQTEQGQAVRDNSKRQRVMAKGHDCRFAGASGASDRRYQKTPYRAEVHFSS
jgi:hypothetical protein